MNYKLFVLIALTIGLSGCFSEVVKDDATKGPSKVDLEFENYQNDLADALDAAKTDAEALRDTVAADAQSSDLPSRVATVEAKITDSRTALVELWRHLETGDAQRLIDEHSKLESALNQAQAKLQALQSASDRKADADAIVEQLAQAQQIQSGFKDVIVVPDFRP